jgi:signal transduction histidine kinase
MLHGHPSHVGPTQGRPRTAALSGRASSAEDARALHDLVTDELNARRSRVLIVEDEGVVALDMRAQVTDFGYDVVGIAQSGTEAIEDAERLDPDVVLMDIRLRGQMDGVTAAKRIHQSTDVPIIFVTAFADESTLRRVEADDPAAYVMKPFDERALGVAIHTVLRQSRLTRRIRDNQRRLAERCEEAQRAVRERDDVLAIVSHDLRTPLTSIAASADLLLRSPGASGLEEQTRERARAIQRGAARMARLVDDLSDVAAVDAGRLHLRAPARCVAADLTREAFQMFEPLAASEARRLVADLPPPEVAVMCDRERVFQVLSNLIGNAIKFTAAGDAITLRAEAAGDEVRFSVRDTGPGLAPAELPHVFERHWQGPGGAQRGSGLGLFIARGIAEAHGGRIWVESEPGEGSTFVFTLPRAGTSS